MTNHLGGTGCTPTTNSKYGLTARRAHKHNRVHENKLKHTHSQRRYNRSGGMGCH